MTTTMTTTTMAATTTMALLIAALPAAADKQRRWEDADVIVSFEASSILPVGQLRHAVIDAAASWTAVGAGPRVEVDPTPLRTGAIEVDGMNTIVFVTEGWAHDPSELGLTFAYVDDAQGRIVEADIAINAEHHAFFANKEEPLAYDLVGLITHELGHVLGLEHLADEDAAMYPEMEAGRVFQREITEVDEAELVELYDGFERERPSGGCAQTSGSASISPLFLLGALFLQRRFRNRAAA